MKKSTLISTLIDRFLASKKALKAIEIAESQAVEFMGMKYFGSEKEEKIDRIWVSRNDDLNAASLELINTIINLSESYNLDHESLTIISLDANKRIKYLDMALPTLLKEFYL